MLLSCQSISKSFSGQNLFSDISLSFCKDERLALIGPNGSGKSTLLKILTGIEQPDNGKIIYQKGMRPVYLAQQDTFTTQENIHDILYDAIADEDDEVTRHNRVQKIMSQMEFSDPGQIASSLSGGWQKRLSIARALVQNPDLLFLDEPTNHLDIEGILRLEKILSNALFAYIIISHDRTFIENTTTRTIELNRCYPQGFLNVKGNYSNFITERESFLDNQQQLQSTLSNKVRREVEWLRRGPKARTTKAQYRIDKAHQLQGELKSVRARNESNKQLQIDFEATGRKTKKLLAVNDISKTINGRRLFNNLTLDFAPGSRLGLMGVNGCGKSTLMHILAGTSSPDNGTIMRADGLRLVLFDQKKEQVNQQDTLREALCQTGDTVIYRDKPLHIVSWAKRFLFNPDQLDQPVNRLSGGEQARILIARLMLQPADILLLDEPGNDLDIPSLSILEDSLMDFPGAVVLVSHDRYFLDRVTSQILGFNGNGECVLYSNYDQWLNDRSSQKTDNKKQKAPIKQQKKNAVKITYREKIELAEIEQTILAAEQELENCQKHLEDPIVTADADELAKWCKLLQPTQEKIEKLYSRWEELEGKNSG